MKFLLICLIILSPLAQSQSCENKGPNVILFTWDGVRNQEFFKGTDDFHKDTTQASERGQIFTTFWAKYANEGMVFGEQNQYQIASSIGVSLPSYQALMVGHANECRNNQCGQIKEETFLEKIKKNLRLNIGDVAVFGSWEGMKNSVAQDSEQILEVIFPEIKNDKYLSPEILLLQNNAMLDLPTWKESRKDKYTFEMALQYLKKKCPRLLYISLVDSDENGHLNDYPGYIKTLRTYDQYLEQIIKTLKTMGQYGAETTLFVTTDHSRGEGEKWISHGTDDKDKNVFLFVRGRGVKPQGKINASATHAQIAPTIEFLMGLSPAAGILPGIR